MKNFPKIVFLFPILFIMGCDEIPPPKYVNPAEQGTVAGVGIESQDLIAATDKMVAKLMDTPQLQLHKGRRPVIGLLPVENRTRFPIDKEIFTTRIKALLNEKAMDQIRFVARDRMEALKKEKELKKQGEVTDQTGRKKSLGVDYFLTGELSGISTSTHEGKGEYLLFTFRLIDPETTEELWEGYHELKKEGVEDAVYR